MNSGAGRGDELFVTLHLQDGEPVFCVVDTGTPGIILDKSLEPKLGGCFWIRKIHPWYGVKLVRLHRAPELYLGNTALQTGGWVWTADLRGSARALDEAMHTNRPIMGILGMSCLRHYCLQMDFTAKEIRFLDDTRANKQAWGKPFHLRPYLGDFAIDENLVGAKGQCSLIDSGCNFDCYLRAKLYKQWASRKETAPTGQAHCPNAILGGENYTNVLFEGNSDFNGIGLTFLSRHLVTFDFPNRTMYLKKISTGPLIDDDTRSAVKFIKELKKQNKLPGWSNNEQAQVDCYYDSYPASGILDVEKSGDPAIYHYAVIRNSADGALKLKRAWQTDGDGKMLREYSVN